MARSDRTEVVEGFTRQASRFARSPLHRDPARLRRLVEWIAPRRGEIGLDVACGPGIVARALAAEGVRVVGADLTLAMLAEARRAAAENAGSAEGVASGGALAWSVFVRGEAERLPFADGTFDFVVSRNSFHHFFDPPACLSQMTRVLRPGGKVIAEDMQAPEDFLQADEHEVVERLRDSAHARTLSCSGFRRLFESAGLRRVETKEFTLTIDFEEWLDRADPSPQARQRARSIVEAGVAKGESGGRRAFFDHGRLMFERRSVLVRGTRA